MSQGSSRSPVVTQEPPQREIGPGHREPNPVFVGAPFYDTGIVTLYDAPFPSLQSFACSCPVPSTSSTCRAGCRSLTDAMPSLDRGLWRLHPSPESTELVRRLLSANPSPGNTVGWTAEAHHAYVENLLSWQYYVAARRSWVCVPMEPTRRLPGTAPPLGIDLQTLINRLGPSFQWLSMGGTYIPGPRSK